jgi:DNA-binding NarL/FixJ family response regulator
MDAAKGFAVNKHTPSKSKQPIAVRRYPHDRLVDLLSSFSHLRSNHQVLVSQLRGSIHELRELRSRLREHNVPRSPAADDKPVDQSTDGNSYGLTRRETQVAKLLAQGRSNQAIARELKISQHTARHHTQRILAKLEVHSRGEAGAKIRNASPGNYRIGNSA